MSAGPGGPEDTFTERSAPLPCPRGSRELRLGRGRRGGPGRGRRGPGLAGLGEGLRCLRGAMVPPRCWWGRGEWRGRLAWRPGGVPTPPCPADTPVQPGCGIVPPWSPGVQAPPKAACRSAPPPASAVAEAAGGAQAESCGLGLGVCVCVCGGRRAAVPSRTSDRGEAAAEGTGWRRASG